MTTSRKPVEAKIVKMVKLAAPVVARSTNDAAPPPVLSFDPSSKAAISRNGSSTRKPNANWVRRRLSWRRTLPLRVELRRQLKRRRTQFAFGFLVLLPFLLMAAFELGSNDSTGRGRRVVRRPGDHRSGELHHLHDLRLDRLPAGRHRRPVRRRHGGQRGELVQPALPAGGAGAPLEAA